MNSADPAALAAFLTGFVRPLVEGGELHVRAPVGRAALTAWEVSLGELAELTTAIDEVRARLAADLMVRPPPIVFAAGDLRLAVALHDALVLAHPVSATWPARRGRRGLEAFVSELIADAGAPVDRLDVVARHTLLRGLPELIRRDVRLTWWTGSAEFRGVAPPRRLTAWPGIRRVREEQSAAPLGEVVQGEAAGLASALLAGSPLTDLLSAGEPARAFAPLRWGAQVELLRDAELARAVTYHWLSAGAEADPAARLRGPAAASAAWEQALATPLEVIPRRADAGAAQVAVHLPRGRASLPAADLRAVTAFLVHTAALVALGEVGFPDLDASSPLVAAALGSRRGTDSSDPALGLRLFFAVPDAAARADAALGQPPGLAGDPRLQRRFAAHRAQVRAALGEERLGQLGRRLGAALALAVE
jgi:hypothetical protein